MMWSPPVVWTVLGVVLIGLEALAPGLVIMFFGLGALITALACLVFDMGLSAQLLVFALASVTSLATLRGTLRKVFRGRSMGDEDLLARMDSLTGLKGVVSEPIAAGGTGRVKLRGTSFAATSAQDLPAGARVRVTADSGPDHALLTVEQQS